MGQAVWRWAGGAATVAVCAVVAVLAVDRWAPPPSADVSRGSEEAFAGPLQLREIPPGGTPLRWTTGRTRISFRDVPAGPATLEVVVRGQRHPVLVSVDGVVRGAIEAGQPGRAFDVDPSRRGDLAVELRVEPFTAGDGRQLGAMLQQVRLQPARARVPSARLLVLFLAPALIAVAAALLSGLGLFSAVAIGLFVPLLQALLLWPHGLVRSAYAATLAVLLVCALAAAAAFARLCERRVAGSAAWAFGAALAAVVVQGLLATSPVMVVSDAVFHANNLARVARGELLLTSLTQHATPFRFPYGVSFYLVLAPFLRAGCDAVALVRAGAALGAITASLVLFLMLLRRAGAVCAGLAVAMVVTLPITLDVHSHGNLSNVFGQALTTAFFAWWAGGAPGGWPAGAALLLVGATGHFSSLVVLGVLAAALVLLAGRETGRARIIAVALGLGLAAAYYLQFAPLVARQLPRLLEGGGQGRGASRGALDALRLQVWGVMGQYGVPALVLAWLGRPRGAGGELGRDLRAYWLAGAALAVLAVVSPLEVRYLYALSIPLSVAAAAGASTLAARGVAGRLSAGALVLAQAVLAALNAVDAVLRRYR